MYLLHFENSILIEFDNNRVIEPRNNWSGLALKKRIPNYNEEYKLGDDMKKVLNIQGTPNSGKIMNIESRHIRYGYGKHAYLEFKNNKLIDFNNFKNMLRIKTD